MEKSRLITRAIVERLRLMAVRPSLLFASGRRLIAAAALLHVVLAVALFCAGRAQIAPRLIDRDGIIGAFAPDSYAYQREAAQLAGVLKERGLRAWAAQGGRAHVSLISIQFALLAPLFGYSTLSAEPLNLFCYVAILSLVLLLGREVAGRRAGLLAAGIVALWPSFLLHTTQLLKDPLFIAGSLALILIVTTWLTRTYSWTGALRMGGLMLAATGLLLLVRPQLAVFIFALAFFGFVLLVVRQLLERRLLYWNLICPVLILTVGALQLFQTAPGYVKLKQYPPARSGQLKAAAGQGRQVPGVITYLAPLSPEAKTPLSSARGPGVLTEKIVLPIALARHKFNLSPGSTSDIDRDVEFRTLRDLLLYLPRASAIGFFAPFPGEWVSAGARVGSMGRLLSGAETFLIYLCELLALSGMWRARRCLAAWLLLLITSFGVIALGLIVSNVGTLYRLRYLFWILLIILALNGLKSIVPALRAEESSRRPGRDDEFKRGRVRLEIKESNKRLTGKAVTSCLLFAVATVFIACCFSSCSRHNDAYEAERVSGAPSGATARMTDGSATASAPDFTLVNYTGLKLHAVYVSPHESEAWEENILGPDELPDRGSVAVRFSPEEKAAEWDLRVEDRDGNNAEWKNLHLREISRITLRFGQDVVVAEVE